MVFPLGDLHRTRIVPVLTYGIITMNVVMYLIELDQGEAFVHAFAATPFELTHHVDIVEPIMVVNPGPIVLPPFADQPILIPHAPVEIPVWLTLFTSMFLHASPMHLLGNMLYLWIFGDNVEEVLGTIRYGLVYLACGLVGTVAQTLASPDSPIPTLGASGAIAGIMGMYLVWFPRHRVRVLIVYFVAELPAAVVIGGWILLQVVAGLNSADSLGLRGGVAYLAHLGGAAAGVLFAHLYENRARVLGYGY